MHVTGGRGSAPWEEVGLNKIGSLFFLIRDNMDQGRKAIHFFIYLFILGKWYVKGKVRTSRQNISIQKLVKYPSPLPSKE